jgi:hypothetical protein
LNEMTYNKMNSSFEKLLMRRDYKLKNWKIEKLNDSNNWRKLNNWQKLRSNWILKIMIAFKAI